MYLFLNECNQEFVDKLNIKDFQLSGSQIKKPRDINILTYDYGMFDESENKTVSIANIVGHDSFFSGNIFKQLNELFDSDGDSYHRRSVGMLEYTNDEIIDKLKQSFKSEPIEVNEIEEEQYTISTNGLHRWTTLRCHYLAELQTTTDVEALNKKYEIPVISEKCNHVKTYCNYLLSSIPEVNITMRSEYDNNYRKTGNVKLNFEDETRILNDEELLFFTKSCLEIHNVDIDYNRTCHGQETKDIKSYQEFLTNNFPDYKKGVDNSDIPDKNR